MFGFRRNKPEPESGTPPAAARSGLLARWKERLARTRQGFTGALSGLWGGRLVDAALLEELETQLLVADVGVAATETIMTQLRRAAREQRIRTGADLLAALRAQMLDLLVPYSRPLEIPPTVRPFVILVAGVNGAGKTTTIGKLAAHFAADGRSVMLAAGDTFRAAAIDQLRVWGERAGVPVIAQQQGGDAASVIYDALQAARARGADLLIADTAGRLHTQGHLMDELKKIKRVLAKLDPAAPHEVLLVLDAGIGQNALAQTREFHDALGVTGLVVTKLDGTAKGGVLFALTASFGLPLRYVGLGEAAEDLREFDAELFVDALLCAPAGADAAAAG